MEREINLFKDNFMLQEDAETAKTFRRSLSGYGKHGMEEKNYDILAKQINHLMICFDVYLESEAFYLNDAEFHRMKLFPNSVRYTRKKLLEKIFFIIFFKGVGIAKGHTHI